MAHKITREEWMRGEPGAMYGIFNLDAKRFMFGIAEVTPMLSIARLHQRLGADAKLLKFRVRRLSRDAVKRYTDSIFAGAVGRFSEFDSGDGE